MARYELNLRDYYRILRRHIIVISAVAIGLGGLSFVLSMAPDVSWSATSRVKITQASNIADLMLEAIRKCYKSLKIYEEYDRSLGSIVLSVTIPAGDLK